MKKNKYTRSLEYYMELYYNKPIREIYRCFYIDKNMSIEEVAKTLNVSRETVRKRLMDFKLTKNKDIWK